MALVSPPSLQNGDTNWMYLYKAPSKVRPPFVSSETVCEPAVTAAPGVTGCFATLNEVGFGVKVSEPRSTAS